MSVIGSEAKGERSLAVSEGGKNEISILQKCFAEAFGTGLIVLFGVGSVNSAVFTGAQVGIWQVAIVWGLGIAIAIALTAPISGAHLNPAVSLAFALYKPEEFPMNQLLPYITAQIFGAFMFAFVNFFIFSKAINDFHVVKGIDNFDDDAAVLSAMAFGEYFPNPSFQFDAVGLSQGANELPAGPLGWDENTFNFGNSLFIEALGTFLLVVVIFSISDDKNVAVMNKDLAPFYIGFTISVMISLWAPLNQAGFNPARDFGPRLAAFVIGYGEVAIPGPNYDVFPYILGPFMGAALGGLFFKHVLKPGYE